MGRPTSRTVYASFIGQHTVFIPGERLRSVPTWYGTATRSLSRQYAEFQTQTEIRCCSLYTIQAIKKQKAKLHLVFGEIAQKALLGTEYKKNKKAFWSEKLNGNVVCLAHPSYFIRKGYGGDKSRKPDAQLLEFRERLDGHSRLSDVGDDR